MQLPLPSPILSASHSLLSGAAGLAGQGSDAATAWAWAMVGSEISVADAALLFVSLAGIAQAMHNVARVLAGHGPKLPKEVRTPW